jgi:hypothetical protein
MGRFNLWFFNLVTILAIMFVVPAVTAQAGGSKNSGASEVVVQRVDNNNLIRLRVYIDAKAVGSIRVGETTRYRIPNGPHTIRVAFEDYLARSTEITRFTVQNSRIMFTVTDESIVAIGEEILRDSSILERTGVDVDTSVRSAFESATRRVKRKTKIAVINVDADSIDQAEYILEELIYLSVQSRKNFEVIDRRKIDAFRSSNGIGVPSYDNDYLLGYIGHLLGADIVISGRLDGEGELRRLRVKTLDVKSGNLVGSSSEPV